MLKNGLSEEEILRVLHQVDAGEKVAELSALPSGEYGLIWARNFSTRSPISQN